MSARPLFDLPSEIARVEDELAVFRDHYLATLIGDAGPGPLADWHRKLDALADRLHGHISQDADRPLGRTAAPCVVRNGRIVWRVQVFVTINMALQCPVFRDDPDDGTDSWDCFFSRVEAVKGWIYAPPFDRILWGDTLCVLPPFIAEVDPEFVRSTLDPRTWREVVQSDQMCTEEQRVANLRMVEGPFGRVLNNALLHTLAGLANNHFGLIRDYLGHPHLHGGYTALMPAYIYKVLAAKVDALGGLADDQRRGDPAPAE